MTARFIVGDALTVLRSMPDASVDLVLTSPPFLALRSYLPADHPDKAREMGSEATPGEFIDALLELVEECRRVLAPHGSIAFELGDTYSGSGGSGGDYNEGGLRDGQPAFKSARKLGLSANGYPDRDDTPRPARVGRVGRDRNRKSVLPEGPHQSGGGPGWPLDKSLCLVPELFRFALVYGFNPLTGRETPRWRARNVVRWCRPNPPVGALADKFRPATSDMVIACVGRSRYFDLDAVRTPHTEPERRFQHQDDPNPNHGWATTGQNESFAQNAAGAPPLDWWKVSTQPYKGSHYATWPEDLLVRPIKAMCPERVCTFCGRPSERIIRVDGYTDHEGRLHPTGEKWSSGVGNGKGAHSEKPGSRSTTTTTGWTDCGHGACRPGVVLDPFAGSGTTLAVAVGHGRDAIGIDLDERNADLARERVGMFLEVETFGAVEARP